LCAEVDVAEALFFGLNTRCSSLRIIGWACDFAGVNAANYNAKPAS
jgi:hypothetical protein